MYIVQFKKKNVLIIVVNSCFKSKYESPALFVVVVCTGTCELRNTLYTLFLRKNEKRKLYLCIIKKSDNF